MQDYRNIVCPIDFSVHSRKAAERAADLARRYGAQLTLLYVVEYFPEDRSNEEIAPEDVDPAAYRGEKAKAELAELAQHLGYDKLEQKVRFSTYSAKHEIVHFAEEQNTDLIVIASHGRHGITSILGSTAYGVSQIAPCDVLTIRAKS
jgi:universal stress protein A